MHYIASYTCQEICCFSHQIISDSTLTAAGQSHNRGMHLSRRTQHGWQCPFCKFAPRGQLWRLLSGCDWISSHHTSLCMYCTYTELTWFHNQRCPQTKQSARISYSTLSTPAHCGRCQEHKRQASACQWGGREGTYVGRVFPFTLHMPWHIQCCTKLHTTGITRQNSTRQYT